MERLTSRNEKGDLLLMGKQVYAGDFYEAVSALEEYEDAEEQGRLVVLPCKAGDKLYNPDLMNRDEGETLELVFTGGVKICVDVPVRDGLWDVPLSVIGKTVFLTREEAEAALNKNP